MKKTLKTALMTLALLALPFAMQAQTKFHDVEANDAKGAVKSITTSMMGQSQTITFTQDGKQENLKNATYDENGYLMNMMGQEMVIEHSDYKYDDKGNWISRKTSVMGQSMEAPRTIVYY